MNSLDSILLHYHTAGGKMPHLRPCADAATTYANEHPVPLSADGHPVSHDQFAAINMYTQDGASFNCTTHLYKDMNSLLRPGSFDPNSLRPFLQYIRLFLNALYTQNMCMYICMYVYVYPPVCMCMCMFICMYVYICIYVYVYVYPHVCVCVCLSACMCMCMCMYICMFVYVYVYVACMCMCMYICMHVYLYVYACMHVYVYACMCMCMCMYICMYACVCICK